MDPCLFNTPVTNKCTIERTINNVGRTVSLCYYFVQL